MERSAKPSFGASSPTIAHNRRIFPGLMSLTKKELSSRLKAAEIDLPIAPLKCTLRALCVLSDLGLISRGKSPNPRLLNIVAEWCQMRISMLHVEIAKTSGTSREDDGLLKASLLRILIESQLDDDVEALAKLTIHDAAKQDPPVQVLPAHRTINLILAILATESPNVAKSNKLPKALQQPQSVMRPLIDLLPMFPGSKLLANLLKQTSSLTQELLTSICSPEISSQFWCLRTNPIASNFPPSVHQFMIVTTTPELEAQFQTFKASQGQKSRILFHGTPLCNLKSILREGFSACSHGNGVWLAEEPMVSYIYASKATPSAVSKSATFITIQQVNDWVNSPYKSYGALLACEAAGNGRPSSHRAGTTHCVSDLKSVIPRYLFLLPPDVLGDGNAYRYPHWSLPTANSHIPPSRAVLVPEIEAGLKKLNDSAVATTVA